MSDRVLVYLDCLKGGVRCCLILQWLVGISHNKIVNIVHVGFVYIFLPWFLIDDLVDVLLFEVGHLYVTLGKVDVLVWVYCWHIQVEKGHRYIGHDGWLSDITVGRAKVPLQLIHHPGELVRVSRSKIEDVAL